MRLASFFSLSLLALAACNKGSDSAPQSASEWPSFDQAAPATKTASTPLPKACALVPAEQAQVVLAQPVSLMSDEPENCIWASAGNPGQITMLMVNVSDNDDVAMAQTVFNALTGLQGNLSGTVNAQLGEKTKKSGQELEDLGDEAWVSGSNMDLIGTQQLVVRKGARILTLNITGMTKGKGMSEGLAPRLQALARSAARQL
ncbi:MAG: hypothetical protein Q7J29_08055 [Stagnimonas sp.]|nr:hypothetical protein [Stagnimonas sp.]